MTKKDYIKMAHHFHEAYHLTKLMNNLEARPKDVISSLVKDFASMLKADNPNFNIEKWYEAIFSE